jgi:hypothetical protein
MSDTSPFHGGGTALAEQPPVEEIEDGRRIKPMYVVAAVAAVAVLAAAAYFLLFSGGGSEQPSGTVSGAQHPSTAPSASTNPSTKPTAVASAPSTSGRDPFAPLAVPAATVAGGTGTTATGGTGGTGTTGTGSGSGSGVSAPAGVQQVVALKAVSTASGSATLTVNNKSYIAHLGETFAQYFQLRGVSKSCGYFLYGDMSFQLCGTQTVTLKS